jgi:MFS family permease
MTSMPTTRQPFGERLLLGLYAAVPLALLVATLIQLFPPSGLAAPASRPAWLDWATVGGWSIAALLFATVRSLWSWRAALGATAALLLGAAAAGLWLHTADAGLFAIALTVLAGACAALAAAIDPRRVRHHRPTTARAAALPHARPRLHRRIARGLPFWIVTAIMVESFRLAHLSGAGPQRGAGMVGMLLAFFLLLPAAALNTWLPRSAAALAAICAGVSGWLGWRSGLPQWWIACALSTTMAAWWERDAAVRHRAARADQTDAAGEGRR